MLFKYSGWVLVAAMAVTSGCSSTDTREGWSGGIAQLNPWKTQPLSKEFKEARRTLDHPEKTLLAYAQMKEDNEEYAEAKDCFREILVAYPDNVDAQLGLARIEIATGRFQQAEEQLGSLVRQRPEDASIRMAQGQMYARLEDWDKAIAAFQKSTELKPNEQVPRFELGLALAKAGRVNEAIPHLTFAVGEPAAMYNVGYILQEQGQKSEAIGWYQEALDHHPDPRTAQRARQMLSSIQDSSQGPGRADSQLAFRAADSRPGVATGNANRAASVIPTHHPAQPASAQGAGFSGSAPIIREAAFHAASPIVTPKSDGSSGTASSFQTASPASSGFQVPVTSGAQQDVPQWQGPGPGRIRTNDLTKSARQTSQDPPPWRQNP